MIVFGIHWNFFIVLPIRLKTCRSNGVFLQGRMCAPEFRARFRGFTRSNAPDRHRTRNLSRPEVTTSPIINLNTSVLGQFPDFFVIFYFPL